MSLLLSTPEGSAELSSWKGKHFGRDMNAEISPREHSYVRAWEHPNPPAFLHGYLYGVIDCEGDAQHEEANFIFTLATIRFGYEPY